MRRAEEQFETITKATEAISGASVSFDPGTLAVKIEEMPSTKTDLSVRLGAFAEAPPCLDTEGSGALTHQAEAEGRTQPTGTLQTGTDGLAASLPRTRDSRRSTRV